MDPTTGREFNYPNPQDDPHLYPVQSIGIRVSTPNLVGMTVSDARNVLKQRGLALRVTVEDGSPYMLTMDYRRDRVNVEVKDGKVVRIESNG